MKILDLKKVTIILVTMLLFLSMQISAFASDNCTVVKIPVRQIFDSEEYETKRREAVLSVVGAHAFIDYLFDVLEGQKKNESRSDNVVEQLKDYIEQNLNEDLSRSVLAGKVFLSEDYVSKIFMKTTGMSLPNYIAERRIERAKEYLRSSSLPISKIAMEVGYGNFSYFSKTFRELVGCTPNEYRSRQK